MNTLEKASASQVSRRAQSISSDELLSLEIDELFARLNTSQSGLASQEAQKRLEIYGYNELVRKKKRAAIVKFLVHFRSPLVIILLLAALISGLLGEVRNTAIISTIVLISVLLDFYQESTAEKAAEMLSEKVPNTATVLRDGLR